jgi:hypothetical protein
VGVLADFRAKWPDLSVQIHGLLQCNKICCSATWKVQSEPNPDSESAMPEYGDIFDYQFSMMGFEYLNLAFFAAYGLAIIWLLAHRKSSTIDTKILPQSGL